MGSLVGRITRWLAAVVVMMGLPTIPPTAAADIIGPNLADLVATLLPTVVNITTIRYRELKIAPGKPTIAEDAQSARRRTFGSGFVISPDGYVLTNKHTVNNGIAYWVTLSDGRHLPADFVAQAIAYDIAVIKIRTDRPLPLVKLGDSGSLRPGDPVIAIGNPHGYADTVTTGIISALNRDLGLTQFDDFIQTDAAINEGNSGGPLFDWKGEVIGVNTAIFTPGEQGGSIGIGFAIPVNDAKFVISHMLDAQEGRTFRPAFLGATMQSVTPDLATAYGLPDPWGSVVAEIAGSSPAARAGLRVGDAVLAYNGDETRDARAVRRAIIQTPAGTTVMLDVWRDGKTESVPVTLDTLPANASLPAFLAGPGAGRPDIPAEALANFGLRLAPITADLRAKYRLSAGYHGVVVTGVVIGSEAADRGINTGAVILRVRDTPVASPEEVYESLAREREQKRAAVPMLISDADGVRWVPFVFE